MNDVSFVLERNLSHAQRHWECFIERFGLEGINELSRSVSTTTKILKEKRFQSNTNGDSNSIV